MLEKIWFECYPYLTAILSLCQAVLSLVLIATSISNRRYTNKTTVKIDEYIAFVKKYESLKKTDLRYLVFGNSFRQCREIWRNDKRSLGMPDSVAKFITFDSCPESIKGFWVDVHEKKIELIGLDLRGFDKLFARSKP